MTPERKREHFRNYNKKFKQVVIDPVTHEYLKTEASITNTSIHVVIARCVKDYMAAGEGCVNPFSSIIHRSAESRGVRIRMYLDDYEFITHLHTYYNITRGRALTGLLVHMAKNKKSYHITRMYSTLYEEAKNA